MKKAPIFKYLGLFLLTMSLALLHTTPKNLCRGTQL